MGNEVGRCCRFARLPATKIQELSDNNTTVNHIKTKEFQGLVPNSGGENLNGSVNAVSLGLPGNTDGDPPKDDIGDQLLADVGHPPKESEVVQGSEDPGEMTKSERSGGNKTDADGVEIAPRPRLSKRVEDGETKHMAKSSSGLRSSKSRLSGASFLGRTGSGTLDARAPNAKDGGLTAQGPATGAPFPKRPMACKLSAKTWSKLEELFRLMDEDGSNAVTREEARAFFKGAFSNLSADAMFNEVDVDGSGAITSEEFVKFWLQVRSSGYKEQEILDELGELIEGCTWRDWKDGRDTDSKKNEVKFPSRPMLCRLSQKAWSKCEELFYKIAGSEKELTITIDKAQAFFKGAFGHISADAMFNEIDLNRHGVITPKEFMQFWVQVKAAGYKEKDIIEEIDSLMEGSPWVDWKDGRKT